MKGKEMKFEFATDVLRVFSAAMDSVGILYDRGKADDLDRIGLLKKSAEDILRKRYGDMYVDGVKLKYGLSRANKE